MRTQPVLSCTSKDNTEILMPCQMSSHQWFSNIGALLPGALAAWLACTPSASGKHEVKRVSSSAFRVSLQMAFAGWGRLHVAGGQSCPCYRPVAEQCLALLACNCSARGTTSSGWQAFCQVQARASRKAFLTAKHNVNNHDVKIIQNFKLK